MRLRLNFAALLLWCGIAPSAYCSDILSVVAKFESIEEMPDPCASEKKAEPSDNSLCMTMDALFVAKYSVLEVISGDAKPGQVLRFSIADHYGYPNFAMFNTAVLTLRRSAEGYYLEKYLAAALHQTKTGDWATCGYPSTANETDGELEPIVFAPGVIFGTIGQLNMQVAKEEFPPPLYSFSGQDVLCTKGWRLKRVVEHFAGIVAAREHSNARNASK